MNQIKVDLPSPITIGEKEITSVNLRKPKAGEMRGLKTMDLLQMDINAHSTLIPRICPDITTAVFNDLEPENLTAIQGEVVNFLVNTEFTNSYVFRKPKAGEMRGLKTMDILQMDINAHSTLMPRICPEITEDVFNNFGADELAVLQGEIVGFFVNADV